MLVGRGMRHKDYTIGDIYDAAADQEGKLSSCSSRMASYFSTPCKSTSLREYSMAFSMLPCFL